MRISLQPTGFTFPTRHRVALWAFTPLISPLPSYDGGIVSVALSLELPPVAVSDCCVLCCPDFPPCQKTRRSPNKLPFGIIHENVEFVNQAHDSRDRPQRRSVHAGYVEIEQHQTILLFGVFSQTLAKVHGFLHSMFH